MLQQIYSHRERLLALTDSHIPAFAVFMNRFYWSRLLTTVTSWEINWGLVSGPWNPKMFRFEFPVTFCFLGFQIFYFGERVGNYRRRLQRGWGKPG